MKRRIQVVPVLFSLMVLGGCVAGNSDFACQAPEGYSCMPVSEVYRRDQQGMSMREDGEVVPYSGSSRGGLDEDVEGTLEVTGINAPRVLDANPGDPLFREPLRIRIWVADWNDDAESVFIPNHYLYVQIDNGKWLLPQIRMRTYDDFNN